MDMNRIESRKAKRKGRRRIPLLWTVVLSTFFASEKGAAFSITTRVSRVSPTIDATNHAAATTTATISAFARQSLLQRFAFRRGTNNNDKKNANVNGDDSNCNKNQKPPPPTPFLIERIGETPNDRVFREIAEMCINVFFKEQLNANPGQRLAPWKETQIAYLKTLQTGDLRRRRQRYPQTNEMFLAYEVKPATSESAKKQPLVLDLRKVYNRPSLTAAAATTTTTTTHGQPQEFVRGDILGFCEITQRPYGIGATKANKRGLQEGEECVRPVLTNLAVSQTARTLGIGSKLLEACEQHVARTWNLNEIILEVEDYNTNALEFYDKRGYDVIFSDPASRRFDVGGIVLRKVRCTRRILRKVLALQRAQSAGEQSKLSLDLFFAKLLPKVGA